MARKSGETGEMGEIKQTNFRVDQDTADAFRNFCEEHGMSQAQGFDHVMQVVEMDLAKELHRTGRLRLKDLKNHSKISWQPTCTALK